MSDPGDLSSKTLNVVLLLLQHILGNEQRKRAVLHSDHFNLGIEPLLDLLPDEVGRGLTP